MGSWGSPYSVVDIWQIRTKNTASVKIEVYILSGDSHFTTWQVGSITPLNYNSSDTWQFGLGDYNNDDVTDLYCFRTWYDNAAVEDNMENEEQNQTDGPVKNGYKMEVHIVDGSNMNNMLLQVETPFVVYNKNQIKIVVGKEYYYNPVRVVSNVYAIRMWGSATQKTEVHILNKETNYTTFLTQIVTTLHETNAPGSGLNFDFANASFWYYPTEDEVQTQDNKILNHKTNKIYNYPNPFNPSTSFYFTVKNQSLVKINVYDMKGALISEVVNSELNAGDHVVNFDASSLSSGIYFYRAIIGNDFFTNKLVVTK